MLFDTHAHLNFNAFKEDVEKIIKQSLKNNILMINVGTNYKTSKRAVEIAQAYPNGVFAAVGLHPIHLETGLIKIKNDKEEIEIPTKGEEFDYEKYKELARSEKVIAIGETGLDYYWKPKTTKKKELFKQKQKELLLQHLQLARELNLPMIFHCRMAHDDLIEILKSQIANFEYKGVIHGFVGTKEQLHEYLKMGFYIGFNGIIFKKIEGVDFERNIKEMPLERILVETDCPYLTPPNFPETRNNPLGVRWIVEEIARIQNLSYEKMAEMATKNAYNLFKKIYY